jgi:tetratricopeptide (TPR) repeat protein
MRVPVLGFLVLCSAVLAAAPSDEALRLRNAGIAELENEQPANAERIFLELTKVAPDDRLAYANLAIAALRQQKFDDAKAHVAEALAKSPGEPQLLAIEAEIYHWSGDDPRALEILRKAAAAAPEDPEIQYALYRQAGVVDGEGSVDAAGEALERLVRLRPENLVVLLQQGIRAREAGDREAATRAFLRIRELSWQAQPAATQMLDMVLEALEANKLEDARLPALRLENVLKISPMYRESLRELSTGIQGVPILTFEDEPQPQVFGDPLEIRFAGTELSGAPTVGRALGVGDFDGDEVLDLARIVAGDGGAAQLEVRAGSGQWKAAETLPAPAGVDSLLVADLDNDGRSDLIAHGPGGVAVWRAGQEGGLAAATDHFGLGGASGTGAEAFDFDIEGDLDLVLASDDAVELYRNSLTGALEAVGENVFDGLELEGVRAVRATDHDRDGDLDLLFGHAGGLTLLDNLRQGDFVDVTAAKGLGGREAVSALASVDFDNDGWPDLAMAGKGLTFLRNNGGRFEAWELGGLKSGAAFGALTTPDLDNDGRLDVAVAGPVGLALMAQRADGSFDFVDVAGGPSGATALANADLDGDGDLDLIAAGAGGLHLLDNEGGNKNKWLSVRLRGLDKGNSKNNMLGRGATLEVRSGRAYQFREAVDEVTHFGLGSLPEADLLRVVWTNGVPQNRLDPQSAQRVVEEQVLKGSCPFLYVWNGEEIAFVTDLLWGAPAGLPLAPGVWMDSDPTELLVATGAQPRDGVYDLRVTEELWEAAFFDYLRLWVVDYPADLEVTSALRIVPGGTTPETVLGTRDVRPMVAALDASGADVTEAIRHRDEVYADGWTPSSIQGVALEPWTFTFDLGEAPAAPVRLVIDGWIFPTDASLNIALAQRSDLSLFPPRLEVETAEGWETLMPNPGFPAGKTKTMIIDTPPLPPESRRLRIVGSQWLSWDRIAWSLSPADDEPMVVAKLEADTADLRYRGFSAPVRMAPNAPHAFDYSVTTTESPWLPFAGGYTRFGDVRELLREADDRSVVLGPGDEIRLGFDASELPPVRDGWRRAVFLESHGWDKDADRNTGEGLQVEPLPYRAMSSYPYGPDDAFPDTPLHREYLESWQTRVVAPESPSPSGR